MQAEDLCSRCGKAVSRTEEYKSSTGSTFHYLCYRSHCHEQDSDISLPSHCHEQGSDISLPSLTLDNGPEQQVLFADIRSPDHIHNTPFELGVAVASPTSPNSIPKSSDSSYSQIVTAARQLPSVLSRLLSDHKVDLNVPLRSKDGKHAPALIQAVQRKEGAQVVASLIEAGADVALQSQGLTALHYAAMHSRDKSATLMEDWATLEVLIAARADINLRFPSGLSLLTEACRRGDALLATWLVDLGADVNQPDQHGLPLPDASFPPDCASETRPIIEACRRHDLGLARFLVAAGAEVRELRAKIGVALGRESELARWLDCYFKVPAINYSKVHLRREVGKGNFGVVFEATYLGARQAAKVPKSQLKQMQQVSNDEFSEENYYCSSHFVLAETRSAGATGRADYQPYHDHDHDPPSTPSELEHIYYGNAADLALALSEQTPQPTAPSNPNHYVKAAVAALRRQVAERREQRAIFVEFLDEVLMSSRIGLQPNVVRFFGAHVSLAHSLILMDYMPQSFQQFLAQLPEGQHLAWSELATLLEGASRGLWALHELGILHRDVAARNFLVDRLECCICDFGLSRELVGGATELIEVGAGPLKWMAPESLQHSKFSIKSDVFMFGMFMWEVLARSEPYPGLDHKVAASRVALENMRPPLDPSWPVEYRELMQSCWSRRPEDRPTMEQVNQRLHQAKRHLLRQASLHVSPQSNQYSNSATSSPGKIRAEGRVLNLQTWSLTAVGCTVAAAVVIGLAVTVVLVRRGRATLSVDQPESRLNLARIGQRARVVNRPSLLHSLQDAISTRLSKDDGGSSRTTLLPFGHAHVRH